MYEGGCQCERIRYRATGNPDFPHLCSCPHCQKLGGGPVMAWVDFPAAGFEWTGPGGEPQWWATFPTTKRGFCPACGTTLAAIDTEGDLTHMVGVTIMSLDNPGAFVPEHQSFRDNAVSWLPVIGSPADDSPPADDDRKWLPRDHIHTENAMAFADVAPDPAPCADDEHTLVTHDIRIAERIPSGIEYQRLRTAVGWRTPTMSECENALEASLYSVVAECEGAAVGMARVIGDGLYNVVVDVIVFPDFQGRGVGTAIMEHIIAWVDSQHIPHAGLVAEPAVASFYQLLGFRPSGTYLRLEHHT